MKEGLTWDSASKRRGERRSPAWILSDRQQESEGERRDEGEDWFVRIQACSPSGAKSEATTNKRGRAALHGERKRAAKCGRVALPTRFVTCRNSQHAVASAMRGDVVEKRLFPRPARNWRVVEALCALPKRDAED